MKSRSDLDSVVKAYMEWENRRKWLLLRSLAYEQIREDFKSPEKIDGLSAEQFKNIYLNFCSVIIDEKEHHLTVGNYSNFFEKYTLSELESLTKERRIRVLGNASWTQLHMGFKLGDWEEQKRCMKHLIFGDDGISIERVNEQIVEKRLRKTLEGELAVEGLGRAKLTSLLLICDVKDRFGVWNTVSNEALEKFGLKSRSDITQSRDVSHYLEANRTLNKLKKTYGFESLADVDQFVWYALQEFQQTKEKSMVEQEPKAISKLKIPLDLESLTHTKVQGLLVELGNMLGYDTYVADPSKEYGNTTLGGVVSLREVPTFTYPEVIEVAKDIDVIWFREKYPEFCFEVEHTTNIRDGLLRLYQISPLRGIAFFIIGPSDIHVKFEKEVSRSPFKIIRDRYKFKSYKELLEFIRVAETYYKLKADFLEMK